MGTEGKEEGVQENGRGDVGMLEKEMGQGKARRLVSAGEEGENLAKLEWGNGEPEAVTVGEKKEGMA